MSSSYLVERTGDKCYRQKLTIAGQELRDPLDAAIQKHVFTIDARQWPGLEIGNIYICLVEGSMLGPLHEVDIDATAFKSYM